MGLLFLLRAVLILIISSSSSRANTTTLYVEYKFSNWCPDTAEGLFFTFSWEKVLQNSHKINSIPTRFGMFLTDSTQFPPNLHAVFPNRTCKLYWILDNIHAIPAESSWIPWVFVTRSYLYHYTIIECHELENIHNSMNLKNLSVWWFVGFMVCVK